MSEIVRKKASLLLALLVIIFLPLFSSLLITGQIPPVETFFPQYIIADHPDFSLPVFLILGSIAVLVFAFMAFPGLFGFTRVKVDSGIETVNKKKHFPWWFWSGLAVCIIGWIIMWGQFKGLEHFTLYAFVPMWWGFIFFLDGLVYYRTADSLFARKPQTLATMGLFSIFAWEYYEYLSFFVRGNWYYPNSIYLNEISRVLWFGLSFSTVWPAVFEWYMLLSSFPALKARYSSGPALSGGRAAAIGVGLLGLLIMIIINIWPFEIFWLIWVAPEMVIAAVLILNRVWTPFHPISKGDWSPLVLMGMAALCNSLFWEGWNYYSWPGSPNSWHYTVPYVQKFLIFEMPLLGYTGYPFFGVAAWNYWILFAHLCGISPVIRNERDESFNA